MGKTTSSKCMAARWASGSSEELNKFHFTFHITLKQVKHNIPIEKIIIEQHCELQSNNVKPEEIRYILEQCSDKKHLLIMDGHDEYKTDTNSDIDEIVLKRKFGNCSLILTSRQTEGITEIKNHMDVEVEICGFNSQNAMAYIAQSLGSDEEMRKLLEEVASNDMHLPLDQEKYIFNYMQIPILLNMICVLFKTKAALPKTKTGIVGGMTNRYMAREAKRAQQGGASAKTGDALLKLGKLAWKGLIEKKYIFEKVKYMLFNERGI